MILSGLLTPTNPAPDASLARVTFLFVATATDAPMPNVPPDTSGSSVSDVLLSSIITANNSSAAACASDEPSATTFTSVSFTAVMVKSPDRSRLVLSPTVAKVSLTSLMPRAIAPAIPTPPSSSPPPPTPDEANTPNRLWLS